MKPIVVLGMLGMTLAWGCEPAGALGENRLAEGAVAETGQWEIRWDQTVPPPVGQYLGLRNMALPGGQSIKYYLHIYGIELAFTEDETRNIRFESAADLPVITLGDRVSIEVRSARFLTYQPREDGVSLGWSDAFAYEWQVLSRDGEAVMPGTRVRLHNTRADADLIYCPSDKGISLGWSKDCPDDTTTEPRDKG